VVGKDLTVEQGYEAARYAALTSLAAVKYALGDLDRVQQIVQLIGYVNSAPGFGDQPRVINGATDLLVDLFGERGKPTRAAIGCPAPGRWSPPPCWRRRRRRPRCTSSWPRPGWP
jgi:hypothetical protein